jgi:hypothetical protein
LKEEVLAVIVVVPKLTAVAIPAALMVATAGTLDVQITELVMFWVVVFFALPKVPIAVNWTVWPTLRAWVVGVTSIESRPLLEQPMREPRERVRQRSESPRTEQRANM